MSKVQYGQEKPGAGTRAAREPTEAAAYHSVPFDRSAAERLVELYDMPCDKVYPILEEASRNHNLFLSTLTAPTRAEIAEQILRVAEQLDQISPDADFAVCMGVDNLVTNWRIGWAKDLSMHIRKVSDVYGNNDETGYHVFALKSRKNREAIYMKSLILFLAHTWRCYNTEKRRLARRVRAYPNSWSVPDEAESARFSGGRRRSTETIHDGHGFSGNRGAKFVLDAAELLTGHQPSLETISTHLRAARRVGDETI